MCKSSRVQLKESKLTAAQIILQNDHYWVFFRSDMSRKEQMALKGIRQLYFRTLWPLPPLLLLFAAFH